MKKTGELLKEIREKKGLSLNEISLALKISPKVLKAIEEADPANLPAKTFLRGFVQSYANYLKTNSDEIMNTFYEEVGSTRPKPLIRETLNDSDNINSNEIKTDAEAAIQTPIQTRSQVQQSNTTDKTHLAPINEKNNTKSIIIAVIGAILLCFILFTKKMIDKYSKEAQVDNNVQVSQPIENETPKTQEEQSTTVALGNAATPTPSPSSSPTPSPTPSLIASLTQNKSVAPTPVPSPVSTTQSTATTTSTPAPIPTPSPSPKPEEEKSKSVELIIEALDTVDIEYASNNGKKSSLKLSSEQVHTFKSKNGLKVTISNGGAVNLILNGRDQGIPGDLGKPITLSY